MTAKGRRIGYWIFWGVYTPLVLLANREMAIAALFAMFLFLPFIPALLVTGVEPLFEAEQADPAQVVYRGERRPGTLLCRLTAAASLVLLLLALLGGAWLAPSLFMLVPWSARLAALSIGLWLLSPTLPVIRLVLRLHEGVLHYQSRHHPLVSTRYRPPATLDLAPIARIRLSWFTQRGEPALQLVFENHAGVSTTVWLDVDMQKQVELFLDHLQAQRPELIIERDVPLAYDLPPTVKRRFRARQELERKNKLEA